MDRKRAAKGFARRSKSAAPELRAAAPIDPGGKPRAGASLMTIACAGPGLALVSPRSAMRAPA